MSDPRAARGGEVWEREAREPRWCEDHRLEKMARVLVAHVLDGAVQAVARVVDESPGAHLVDHARAARGVGDVEEHRLHLHAGIRRRPLERARFLLRAHAADRAEAAPRELEYGSEPDAGVRPGGGDGPRLAGRYPAGRRALLRHDGAPSADVSGLEARRLAGWTSAARAASA